MDDRTNQACELLPCPFCSSDKVKIVEITDGDGDRLVAVGCVECGCNGTPHIPLKDDARPAAAASWNRREAPQADAAKRVFGMSVQALAGEIVEAVLKDEQGEGCDISAGMFGPNFSNLIRRIVAEYLRKPVPCFDLLAHLQRQREFSERTFGPGARTAGLIDHIRKELLEIEADPGDLAEWIDVAILALDGAWRTGASPQQIIDALVAKQVKNEGRTWPDWRTAPADKAIEHDRSGEVQP